ncbi:MAG: hypothetical protein JWM59_660 [Verrucomicrobiales bacterium]|nr:hypothetical protein [Verrucomicrobiales bacterium]
MKPSILVFFLLVSLFCHAADKPAKPKLEEVNLAIKAVEDGGDGKSGVIITTDAKLHFESQVIESPVQRGSSKGGGTPSIRGGFTILKWTSLTAF